MSQPGAPIATGNVYIEVLRSDLSQIVPDFSWFASQEPYRTLEAFIKNKCILVAYRKDLVDGSRVYRLPNTAKVKFTEDKCNLGNYYALVVTKRYPILDTDPSSGKTATRDWHPV
jgi:hypothetical protein